MGLREIALKAATPLARFVIEAGGSRSSSFSRMFWPGSKVDWTEKAGLVYDNSVVGIAINWMQRNWADAPPIVERRQSDGTWKVDPKHPFPEDWAEPNPWYGDDTLTDGMILSLVASGNAYVAPLRRNNGRPAFVYLPHLYVDVIGGDGSLLVDRYEYRTPGSGGVQKFTSDQMVHFRLGNDPADQKKGMSPLAAMTRDIATDNLGTTYTAAILNRMGTPGMAFIPDDDGMKTTPEQFRAVAESVEKVFTGDGAGKMLVMPWKGQLVVPNGGPEKLGLDSLRSVPTARILAALGVSDIALGLPSQSKTYDNYGAALEAAWENGLMPMKTRTARVLTKFVQRWYGDGPETRVWWDFSRVRALQPDMDALFSRWSQAYTAGIVKRSEAKAALGLAFDSDDEVYKEDATLGINGKTKGMIKAAGALAASRRQRVEDSGDPDAG